MKTYSRKYKRNNMIKQHHVLQKNIVTERNLHCQELIIFIIFVHKNMNVVQFSMQQLFRDKKTTMRTITDHRMAVYSDTTSGIQRSTKDLRLHTIAYAHCTKVGRIVVSLSILQNLLVLYLLSFFNFAYSCKRTSTLQASMCSIEEK